MQRPAPGSGTLLSICISLSIAERPLVIRPNINRIGIDQTPLLYYINYQDQIILLCRSTCILDRARRGEFGS